MIISEDRWRILLGIIVCSVFTIPLYWYIIIFGKPVIEQFSDLQIQELLLFASTSILAFIGLIILCLSVIFMFIKLICTCKNFY